MDREVIDDILLSFPGTRARTWFGTQGYSVAGNMFAAWSHEHIVLRLPPHLARRARQEPRTHPWSPRAWGRPMEGWIQFDDPSTDFVSLAAKAHAHCSAPTLESALPHDPETRRAAAARGIDRLGALIPKP